VLVDAVASDSTEGLTFAGVHWALTAVVVSNWHPLTLLSHMADCQVYGLRPWGHHLTSLLLHVTATVLFFLALTELTGKPWRSLAVAALFALHPLRVESVAWVAERKDVLSVCLAAACLWVYARYARRPRFGTYLLLVVVFAAGLLAKPMLVTLPCVFLLLDWWPLQRLPGALPQGSAPEPGSFLGRAGFWRQAGRLLGEKLPLLGLSVGVSLGALWSQRGGGALCPLGFTLGARLANALVSYVTYLGQTLWPAGLAVFYPMKSSHFYNYPRQSLPEWQVAGAALLLLAITLAALRWARTRPYIPVGWFWYLGVLVPVIGLVQVGEQSHADRYTLLPHLGLLLLLVWGTADLARLAPRAGRRLAAAAAGAVALALAVCTWRQTGTWRDDFSLYGHALAVTEDNYFAHHNLGSACARRGDAAAAIEHFREALRLQPWYRDAQRHLGLILVQTGKYADAIPYLRQALAQQPPRPGVGRALAFALAATGQIKEATEQYETQLAATPADLELRADAGRFYQRQGQGDQAVDQFAAVLRLRPGDAAAESSLADVLYQLGQLDAAATHYRKVLEQDPKHRDARFTLGTLYYQQKKYAEAEKQLVLAVQAHPEYAPTHNTLGAIYQCTGDLQQAKREYAEAVRLDPQYTEARSNLEKVRARLGTTAPPQTP
jgi:tetratricopeptide (TPR) repeat protein